MKPLHLEVIAPVMQGLGLCAACELVMAGGGVGQPPTERDRNEYPAEWQEEARRLADWVFELAGRYGDQIRIKVIDPQSPEGLLKSVRYRVRRYPTFVVAGKKKVVGWEMEALEAAVASALAAEGG